MTDPDIIAAKVRQILLNHLRILPDFWNDDSPAIAGIPEAASEIMGYLAELRSKDLEDAARIVREQIISNHIKMAKKHQDAAADALQGSRHSPHEEDRKSWKELEKRSLILSEYHSSSARELINISGVAYATNAVSTPLTNATAQGRDE